MFVLKKNGTFRTEKNAVPNPDAIKGQTLMISLKTVIQSTIKEAVIHNTSNDIIIKIGFATWFIKSLSNKISVIFATFS